jgi:hypothetical protein
MKIEEPLVYSRPEQRAIIVEALGIFPNVWVVYNYVGKRIGVSYGSIWNIAKAEGVKFTPFHNYFRSPLPAFDSKFLLVQSARNLKIIREG